MKKIILLSLGALFATALLAQDNPPVKKKKDIIDMSNRANDHFLVQFGYTAWAGKPDTINTNGFSKSFNAYFMLDFPFKTNPKMSIAIGPGISSDQILFSKTYVGIKDITPTIRFINQDDTTHFKKTKLATVYFEAPLELRYSADPLNGKKFKFAVGVKLGTIISAHTRNVKFESQSGNTINDYVMKEASKRFINKNRVSAMVRFGMGHISVYGSYQITTLFKDGLGPVVRPYSIGLTLSGL